MRSYDQTLLKEAVDFIRQSTDFDPVDWLADDRNIVLLNDNDLTIFEYVQPGVVTGHYYFRSRGKAALASAKNLLDEIFDPVYNIQVVRGITSLEHLGARWLSRQLGFKSHGVLNIDGRHAELFILHRDDWRCTPHERGLS